MEHKMSDEKSVNAIWDEIMTLIRALDIHSARIKALEFKLSSHAQLVRNIQRSANTQISIFDSEANSE